MLWPKQANMNRPTLKIDVNVHVSGSTLSFICGLIHVRVTGRRGMVSLPYHKAKKRRCGVEVKYEGRRRGWR
jgi:hypothetical protein